MSRARRAVALGVVAAVTAACSPSAREALPYEGAWRSDGFAIYLVVHGGDADIYEFSAAHCARVYGGVARGISDVLSFDGDQLLFSDSGRVIHLDRIDSLPEACTADFWTDEGGRVVEVAAATVQSLYHEPLDDGWPDRVASVSASVDGGRDARVTFAALTDLLGPLADPGVRLSVDDPSVWAGVWASAAGPFAGRTPYVPPGIAESLVSGDDGIVTGRFGTTGYLGLSRLGRFAGDDDGSQIALADALDGVLVDSGAVVIDLRAASSGRAVEAMLIASRFVPTERTVASQSIDGVPAGDITVSPTLAGPFPGQVVLLVGPGTAGAAEMLVLAVRDLPGVVVIGEPTAGSPVPPLARTLPNGWVLGVPAVDLVTPDGVSWSGVSIDPRMVVPTTLDDLVSGQDPGVAAALGSVG